MGNGASRIFNIMKKSGTDTVSEIVYLTVKTIKPLTVSLDNRVTLPKNFLIFSNNMKEEYLKVNDVLVAISLNGGQKYFISHFFDSTNDPYKIKVIDNLTSTDKTAALSANQGKLLNDKINNLNIVKVIDNLTSTDTKNALSANQGRILNSKFNTKLDKCIRVTEANTDLNDYQDDGLFYFNTEVTPINIPFGSNGWLEVKGTRGGHIKQLWYRSGTANSNDHQIAVRSFVGNVWSDWAILLTTKGGTVAGDYVFSNNVNIRKAFKISYTKLFCKWRSN